MMSNNPKNEQVRIREIDNDPVKKSAVPVTVLWNNKRMIRSHSIQAVGSEIVSLSQTLDLVKCNIVGNPGTGKSTLAKTLAHIIHSRAKVPYAIKTLNRDDLIDFKGTLAKIEPMNHVLIFDDVSFLKAQASANKISTIEKELTEIRHLPGGEDVKIIAIFNFHYTMAMSKYLRQSDFYFYTSIGSSDVDNLMKIVGKSNIRTIKNFNRIFHQAYSPARKYSFQLGKKGKMFTYDHRQPFAPLFFYNDYQARIVVFPERNWITPHCNVCAGELEIGEAANMDELDKKLQSKFGRQIIRQALKVKLLQQGINLYSKRTKQAITFIDKWAANNKCDLETLLKYYGLEDQKTMLRVPAGLFETESDPKTDPKTEDKPPSKPERKSGLWTGIHE